MQQTPDQFSKEPYRMREDTGFVVVATDNSGRRYGLVVSHQSAQFSDAGAAATVGAAVRNVCSAGAEVIALASGFHLNNVKQAKTNLINENVITAIASYNNRLGIPYLAGDLYCDVSNSENCLVTAVALGIVREDYIMHNVASAQSVYILVGKQTDTSNPLLLRHLLKATNVLFKRLRNEGLMTGVSVMPFATSECLLWTVPPHLTDKILHHFNKVFALPQIMEGAGAFIIDKPVVDTSKTIKTTNHLEKKLLTLERMSEIESNHAFLTLLAQANIASRSPIFAMHDKQVQGRTLIEAGCADAGVLQPFNDDFYPEEIRHLNIALALTQYPRCSDEDAYLNAMNAVVKIARNIVAVGAVPIALTGNIDPLNAAEFQRGINDACTAIELRVVASNTSDSFSLSCIGIIPSDARIITCDLKRPETILMLCKNLVDLTISAKEIQTLHIAIQQKLVLSAHAISNGNIAVVLAKMSFKNNIGVNVDTGAEKLFDETNAFVLEVARDKVKEIKKLFETQQLSITVIGETTVAAQLKINNVIDIAIQAARHAWENGLKETLCK